MNANDSTSAAKVEVLIVGGTSLTRFALTSLIKLHPLVSVVEETATARQARSRCAVLQPKLTVIDIDLIDGDGIVLLRELQALHAKQLILVMSDRDDMQTVRRVLESGARAYLRKSDDCGQILGALEAVLAGRMYVSGEVFQKLLGNMAVSGRKNVDRKLSRLSDREFHVFRLIGEKTGASKIAQQLGVSVKTVETHQQRIKQKLNLQSASELHRTAERWCIRTDHSRLREILNGGEIGKGGTDFAGSDDTG